MVTRVKRTYTYICPSCGKTAAIYKSSSSIFESLELEESDVPRCVNCKATFCGSCAKHGLCPRCLALIPPKLNEKFADIKSISKLVPILISITILITFIAAFPKLLILWLFVGLVIGNILFLIGTSIGISIRNSKIKEHFPNQKSEYKPFLAPRTLETRKYDKLLKTVILKKSRSQKNKKIGLDFFGMESNESSPKVIRETLIDMIENNEINAELDSTQRYITFY